MKILMLLNEAQPLRSPKRYRLMMRVWRMYRRDLIAEVKVQASLNPRVIHVTDILSARDTTGEPVPFSDAEGTLRMARREHVSILDVAEVSDEAL